MFEINEKMYNALLDIGRDQYIKNKSSEFAEKYPDRQSCIGYEKIEEFMYKVWEKAEYYNLPSDKEFNILVMLMCFWGCDFDIDPQYPWARLKRFVDTKPAPRCTESESLRALTTIYHEFYRVYKKIVGKNLSYVIHSYKNITNLKYYDFISFHDDSDVLTLLSKIYPEKRTYLREYIFYNDIIPAAKQKSSLYQLDSKIGTSILTVLIFTCGISFDTDPLCYTLNKKLTDNALPGMQKEQALFARAQELVAANLRCLTLSEENSHDAKK